MDRRWEIANEAAIAISYPTSASEMLVLLKTPKEVQHENLVQTLQKIALFIPRKRPEEEVYR